MTLSHFDDTGRARMVDVSHKSTTVRTASARGWVLISESLEATLRSGTLEKGDAFTLAKVAGIMAAKQTSNLIPLCHPLALDWADVSLTLSNGLVQIDATAKTSSATGVEMEALTAVSVAALTFYDMVKAVDKGLVIEGIHLREKQGGRSGDFFHPHPPEPSGQK